MIAIKHQVDKKRQRWQKKGSMINHGATPSEQKKGS